MHWKLLYLTTSIALFRVNVLSKIYDKWKQLGQKVFITTQLSIKFFVSKEKKDSTLLSADFISPTE